MAGLFDQQSEYYVSARPHYPSSLFEFVVKTTSQHHLAWDVGAGNAQAAVVLSKHYEQVIATDVSEQQLKHAPSVPNIKYAVTSPVLTKEEIDQVVGGEGSVDLITIAQALHWFDLDAFYEQVRYVLRKPGGVIAAWSYQLPSVSAEVNAVMEKFYETTRPYWESARILVDEEYRTIKFPFQPVAEEETTGPFRFESSKELNLEQLLMYFRSWSAIQTSINKGLQIIEDYRDAFVKAWGNPVQTRTVVWPVHLLIGKVSE